MSNNDNIDEERNGLWFWIPLVLILLVLFFIIRSCSNDDQLWQSSTPDATSGGVDQTADAIGDALNSAKSTAGGVISDAAKTATGAVGDMADSATTVAGNAATTAGNTLSDTTNSVTGAAQSAGGVASGLAGSALNATKSAGDAVTTGGKAVTGAASDALGAAGSAVQATGDRASRLGSAAVNSVGKTADMATNAAHKAMNIPRGVLQGDVVNLLSSGKLVAGKHYPAGTLHFDSSKSVIGKGDQAILDAITQIAKANPSIKIHLHGHADSSGPEKFNQYVSTQRALGAKNLLINAGVSAQQIETHGHGSENPVASNSTSDGRLQNRRTEIEIER
jgi:outer membrane protein OmpA-like peptidoglycan-associated protein